MKLEIGSLVPDFELIDQDGKLFRINQSLGKKNLVIFFYPKDETPGCTLEACSFRDAYEDFREYDAEIIGISCDGEESHRRFADHHSLPFTLLSDPDGKIRDLFGVPRSFLGLLPGRTTYISDKNGNIIYIFNSQLDSRKHVEIALETLRKLKSN
jgi:thioredoxin-dependent peroxiredoxin